MTAEVLEQTPEAAFLEQLRALNTDRLFVYIELDRLKIDTRYQRSVSMTRVRKIAAKYDPDLMGVLVCSVREDGIYVIDGQHRLEVARLLGHSTIRCELRLNLTVEQEANIFYNLDTQRTALGGADGFRALLVAQDPVAMEIAKSIEDAGLRLTYTGAIIGGVRSYKTLIKMAQIHGTDTVTKALQVLGMAWPTSETPATATVVEGMVYFLVHYPDVKLRELARALATHTNPKKLTEHARAISGSMSWNTKTSMGRAILAAYNVRRRDNRLDDRFTHGEGDIAEMPEMPEAPEPITE